MKSKRTAIIGMAATAALYILTMINDRLDDKLMEERINEGISKALAERERES